jgi:hypothetical protein
VDAGYCLPEIDHIVEDEVATKGKGHGNKLTYQKAEPGWVLAVDAFKLPDIIEDEFLCDCKVRVHKVGVVWCALIEVLFPQLYLCGFNRQQLEKLTTILRRVGGVRCGALDDAVTHVVMGTREVKVQEQVHQLGTDIHVVRPQWLLDSCAQGSKVPEEGYEAVEGVEKGGPREKQNGPAKK